MIEPLFVFLPRVNGGLYINVNNISMISNNKCALAVTGFPFPIEISKEEKDKLLELIKAVKL